MSADGGGSGRGVRIAIVDSGVHAAHPHVGSVAGGVTITEHGEDSDYADRLGHGTAVAAVIREKAPDADLFAVRIFTDRLSSSAAMLVRALDWAARCRMHLVNLSLGTTRPEHEAALRGALHRAAASGVYVVAARDDEGVRYFPGSVPHPAVVPVQLDWACPRETCYTADVDGVTVYRASGWPRSIPGVPPSRNLNGISFAVANVTGILARRPVRAYAHATADEAPAPLDPTDGGGESQLGLHAHPRCPQEPRAPRRPFNDCTDPANRRHSARAGLSAVVADVPAVALG